MLYVYLTAMGCEQSVDIKVDSDAHKRKIDPTEIANLDVYVSTLSSAVASGLVVVKEFGLVSGTCARVKGQGGLNAQEAADVKKWAIENTHESESAKSMAIAKLRTKAKRAGANAVLGLKVDMESNNWGNRSMTLATATGTACTLADMNAIVLLSPENCLYVDAPAAQPPREVNLPAGPLGIVFAQGSNIIAAVNETSPLRGIVGAGARVKAYAAPGCTEVDCTRLTDVEITALVAECRDQPGRRFVVY